jgi:hypothetical protein
MHPSNALPDPDYQRTSFVHFPAAHEPLWFGSFADSFIVPAPRRRPRTRRPRPPARPPAKPDPWQPMAGRLELVADVARQCARAARGRDPEMFDRLMDAVREALLDAIALHNTSNEYLVR